MNGVRLVIYSVLMNIIYRYIMYVVFMLCVCLYIGTLIIS